MNSSQEESTATIFSSLVHAANDARACYASGSIADSIRMLQDIRRKAEQLERRLLTLTDDHSKNQFAGDLVSPQSHISPPHIYPHPSKHPYGEHRRSPTLPQPNQLYTSRTPPSTVPPLQSWTHAQESKIVSDYGGMSRAVGHRASPTEERPDNYQNRDTSEHQQQLHRQSHPPHHHYHQEDHREHRPVSYPSPYSAHQTLPPQPARIHSPDSRARIPMPPPTSPHPHSPGYGHSKHQGIPDHHPSESYPLQAARSALEALSGSEQTLYRQRRHASLPQVLDSRVAGTDSPSNSGSYAAFAMDGGGSPMQDVQYHRHSQPTSSNMHPHLSQHYQQHYPPTESPIHNRHVSSRPSPTPRSPPIVHPHPYRVPSYPSHPSHPSHPSYHIQHHPSQQPQPQPQPQQHQHQQQPSYPSYHHNPPYHPSSPQGRHPMDENMRGGLRESSKVSTPRNNNNISTLLNNTEGVYSPVATRSYNEGSHEWTEAMDAVTTPLTPTTSAAQATVVQQQQQATRRKSSTSSKTSSSGGAPSHNNNNGPGAPGGMVAMVVRGGNWVGRQRRVSESRSMARVDNTGSRTQFHAPLEPEVVVKLDEIFFKFLQRLCSDLSACDSKGDHIHQPLMAKKMQRLEASTEFRPFKFRIQAFTNAFHDSLIEHGLTEDILPLRKIKVYLWKHRYISRFNEDGKKQKSKGNHVWNIEARKIFPTVLGTTASTPSTPKLGDAVVDTKAENPVPGAGGVTTTQSNNNSNNNNNNPVRWEFREYTSRIAGQIIKFARVGIPYVYTPKIWDAQMSSPAAKFSSPWLPPWLRWHKGELKGVPTAEDRSCTITVVAEYLREGEECHLEMSFLLTVSDPSKEGELMDTPPEDRVRGDVEEEEEEEEEEEGDSELSKEEGEEDDDEVESEVDNAAADDDDDDNYRAEKAHSQGDENEDEDDEMGENGDEMGGSDGAESSQSQRSSQGRKRQGGARSKQTKTTKAATTGRSKRGVRGRGRGRGKRLAK